MHVTIAKTLLVISPFFKSKILKYICKKEGGEFCSQTIRKSSEKNSVYVGQYSYGGCFHPNFNTGGKVIIGRYCSIAQGVRYFGANHPLDHISMSPYFYNPSLGFDVKDVERNTLYIGNDVWIGYGVIITSSCHHIGNGAVLAAGSIVTHDVEPYAIVAGNPARLLKYRFPEDIVKLINKTRWWEKSPNELIKYYQWMNDPEKFNSLFKK